MGKTTVVQRVLGHLNTSGGGFRTERCPAGFKITDIQTGSEALIAAVGEGGALIPHPHVFEDIGVKAIRRALASEELIVMDELGFLELGAAKFQEAVVATLQSPQPVLGVLKKARNSFLDMICEMDGVEVIEVREDNRDRLPGEIAERLDPRRGPK